MLLKRKNCTKRQFARMLCPMKKRQLTTKPTTFLHVQQECSRDLSFRKHLLSCFALSNLAAISYGILLMDTKGSMTFSRIMTPLLTNKSRKRSGNTFNRLRRSKTCFLKILDTSTSLKNPIKLNN